MAKLNYCIIKGGKGSPTIIYVANNDDTHLNPSIVNSDHFQEIKTVLSSHGFEHVMAMTFKSTSDTQPKLRPLISDLREHGFIRSRKLEAFILEQRKKLGNMRESSSNVSNIKPFGLSDLNQNRTELPVFIRPHSDGVGVITYVNPNTSIVGRKRRSNTLGDLKVVDLGEKVELYMYLFLRVNPTEDKSIDFDFECDFYSKNNTELRRYIKMVKCSFIRKESDTEGIMYLESEQTIRDLMRNMDHLFYIRLVDPIDILGGQKPKSMVFSSIELREYLNLDQKISLFINMNERYEEVIELSERIRKEKAEYDHNTQLPIFLLRKTILDVISRMEQRMHYYSEEENYELAASYQKNKEYLQKKIELIKDMESQGVEVLGNQEYEQNFTMQDFDF